MRSCSELSASWPSTRHKGAPSGVVARTDFLATTSTTGSSGSSGALASKTNPPATRAETWSRFSWIRESIWPRGEPCACKRLPPVDTARLFRLRSRRPPGATSMRSPPERSRLSFRWTMAAGGLRPSSPPSARPPLSRITTAAEFVPSPSIVTVQLDRLNLAPAQTPNAAHRPSRGAFDRGRTMSIPSSSSSPDRSSSQTDGAVGSLGSAGVGWKRIRGRVGPGTARMLHGPLPPSGVLERTQSASAATSRPWSCAGDRPRAFRNSSAVRIGGGLSPAAA